MPIYERESERRREGPLTSREKELIKLLLESGCSNPELGRQLGISEETVKRHLSNIMNKTGYSTRTELAVNMLHLHYRKRFGMIETYWIETVDKPVRDPAMASALLQQLGVKVGEFDGNQWNGCTISEEAFEKLDPFWCSTFIWGPERNKEKI